jgi:hypothetical protein
MPEPNYINDVTTSLAPGATVWWYGTFEDVNGVAIPLGSLETLVLSLFVVGSGVAVFEDVNVLNTGRGQVSSGGNYTITFLPTDTAQPPDIGTPFQLQAVMTFTYNQSPNVYTGQHSAVFTFAAFPG